MSCTISRWGKGGVGETLPDTEGLDSINITDQAKQ